jgi:hypothetical protein
VSAVADRLVSGVIPAKQLIEALGVSPATLMRRLQREGGTVLRIGLGRATRYGLIQSWPGVHSARFPLVRIDESGTAVSVGELVTLASGQCAWLPAGEVFHGLPVEISDASPSGFLGQLFARQHADIGVPPRISDWSDHHIFVALSRRGDDLPGNLIVGQESLDRWFNARSQPATAEDYPELADAALAGHSTDRWLGGDRPKFTTFADGRHVLVKFAGQAGGDGGATERWRDLLALEALALDVLREHGMPAAHSQLLSSDTYKFLEVERFDRIGERGRRAVMTLAVVHQNPVDSWSRAAIRLLESRRISADDARRLRLLDAFGALIANTDRHHHNVAFFPGSSSCTLAPAFDQLPMLYAPSGDGSVPVRHFVAPSPTAEGLDVWDEARSLALTFWQNAGDGPTGSDGMRRIAASNARALSS